MAGDGQTLLVDRITTTLRDEIVRGDRALGSHLGQGELASRFGVSRTPIREALHKLEAQGLVELLPHRGAQVKRLTEREIRDAYVVRAELEGLAAALATRLATHGQLGDLRASVARFAAVPRAPGGLIPVAGGLTEAQVAKWEATNDDFHRTIHAASRNERLTAMLDELDQSVPRSLTRVALTRSRLLVDHNVREHEEILEAIEAGDQVAARARMEQHVRRSAELVLDAALEMQR
jgi:DNA-binding GntR family transcriptional regulator